MKNRSLSSGFLGLAMLAFTAVSPAEQAKPTPSKSMLDPTNHTLVLIDHQPQMAFATKSIDIVELRNNVTGLAQAAKAFDVPTILTTVAEKSFSGPLFPELKAVFPEQQLIDRTTMNTWEDKHITDKVSEIGRNKIVIAALWTEVCGVGPALSAVQREGRSVSVGNSAGVLVAPAVRDF